MGLLLAALRPLAAVNATLLALGRLIGCTAMALMVLAILIQVVFRYALNNALPWPDEAARFCMLWLTGLMAPTAFRRGGFVAIDMVSRFLPSRLAEVLSFTLLVLALIVLCIGIRIGWNDVTGFAGRFTTASLYLPTSFDLSQWYRLPRSWMMASLLIGSVLLAAVNLELILRTLISAFGGRDSLPEIGGADKAPAGAE